MNVGESEFSQILILDSNNLGIFCDEALVVRLGESYLGADGQIIGRIGIIALAEVDNDLVVDGCPDTFDLLLRLEDEFDVGFDGLSVVIGYGLGEADLAELGVSKLKN